MPGYGEDLLAKRIDKRQSHFVKFLFRKRQRSIKQ